MVSIYLSSYSPIASPSRGKQAKGRERDRNYGRNGGIVYKCQFWQFERKYCVSASKMWDADLLIFCYGDKLARAKSLFMYCKEIMRSLPNGVLLRDFIFTCVLNQINHLFLRYNVYRTYNFNVVKKTFEINRIWPSLKIFCKCFLSIMLRPQF